MVTHLGLDVLVLHVGAEVETGGVHGACRARHVRPHVGHVSLGRSLHLTELSAEGDDSAPQGQQAAVLSAEVLVERLKRGIIDTNGAS